MGLLVVVKAVEGSWVIHTNNAWRERSRLVDKSRLRWKNSRAHLYRHRKWLRRSQEQPSYWLSVCSVVRLVWIIVGAVAITWRSNGMKLVGACRKKIDFRWGTTNFCHYVLIVMAGGQSHPTCSNDGFVGMAVDWGWPLCGLWRWTSRNGNKARLCVNRFIYC